MPGVLRIRYCPRCRWLARAAWLAQELLGTFEAELHEVALVPDPRAGTFEVELDEEVIWSRASGTSVPEPKQLKRIVRDRLAPQRDLGHVDRD